MFLEVVLKTAFEIFYPQHSRLQAPKYWSGSGPLPLPLIMRTKFGKCNSSIRKSGKGDRAQ